MSTFTEVAQTSRAKAHQRRNDRLANGAIPVMSHGEFVLAYWEPNVDHPWITWRVNERGHTFFGQYFDNYEAARDNFHERAGV